MNISVSQNADALQRVRNGFSKIRRDQSGKKSWYPPALKELALSALEQGHSRADVAKAAGVTDGAVRNWRKALATTPITGKKRPLELKLIESRETPPVASFGHLISVAPTEAMARIEFRPGVRMELPVAAISERLVNLLMGGGS